MKNFFASKKGIILVGIVIGIIGPFLQFLGNPPNMGICVACFERDIAGALGFHRASAVQYIRPEIAGIGLGAFLVALFFKEFRPRGGSSSFIRFFLGLFAMIGALVFLGCPWRTLLRIAGGDGNGLVGLIGLAGGIAIGVLFLKRGYSLGRSYNNNKASGYVFPLVLIVLFVFLATGFSFTEDGAIFFSEKGPGSMHVNIWIGLGAGLIIGILAQRSRFCTIGSFRDMMIVRDFHLITGVASLVVTAILINLLLGQFNPGFAGQPVAHDNHVWNLLSMVLAGLAFTLAGGCPGRQLILAGEGDADAGIFVLGMIAGAAVAHNFSLASSPKGPAVYGPAAVISGLVFCLSVGLIMRQKMKV